MSSRVDQLKPRIAKFGPKIEEKAAELYALIDVDGEKQRAKMGALLPKLKDGDIRRGQAVFKNKKGGLRYVSCDGLSRAALSDRILRRSAKSVRSATCWNRSSSRAPASCAVTNRSRDDQIGQDIKRHPAADSATEIVLQVAADQQVRILRLGY